METSKFDNMHFERKPPKDYGEVIPISDWRKDVDCHCFTDDDGTGYWMKGGMVHSSSPDVPYMYGDNVCDPDEIEEAISHGIDAVMWFNK